MYYICKNYYYYYYYSKIGMTFVTKTLAASAIQDTTD